MCSIILLANKELIALSDRFQLAIVENQAMRLVLALI